MNDTSQSRSLHSWRADILWLFLVNNKKAARQYFAVLLSFLALGLLDRGGYQFAILLPFIIFSLTFSVIYGWYLIYHYILRREVGPVEIRGVNLGIIANVVRGTLISNAIVTIAAFSLAIVIPAFVIIIGNYPLPRPGDVIASIGIATGVMMVYVLISCGILAKYAKTKLFSEALKKNVDLKDIALNDLYTDLREIFIKKISKTE